jgi:hypothetical protein
MGRDSIVVNLVWGTSTHTFRVWCLEGSIYMQSRRFQSEELEGSFFRSENSDVRRKVDHLMRLPTELTPPFAPSGPPGIVRVYSIENGSKLGEAWFSARHDSFKPTLLGIIDWVGQDEFRTDRVPAVLMKLPDAKRSLGLIPGFYPDAGSGEKADGALGHSRNQDEEQGRK